ncbi:Maf-like protein [Tritrichomonas foetus]|uniref:Maf-like protein n=1 Tax=Tritrichomonas foetus TaxID=1144522 RepID=A0A1J4KSE4_9EUKA|nr:Maf-like protein [Tritrichomonas foetus]|eukprot:OHT12732.1 Maf-like protein [Tritrichomonas foetus]
MPNFFVRKNENSYLLSFMKVILGSSSKWRQNLAKKHLGYDVSLLPADIDEKKVAHEANPKTPQEHTTVIAKAKLEHLLTKVTDPKTIIICCDTIVYFDGNILEKPTDHDDCVNMIKMWSKNGDRTEIYTAVAIGSTEPRIILSAVERADVVMTRDLKDEEIEPYIKESGCIQSSGSVIVESLIDMNAAVIDGDQTVIEGLPISCVKRMIEEIAKKF